MSEKRVILYGRTVILGTLEASLRKSTQLEVLSFSAPYPGVQELKAMAPDVILFDLANARPDDAFALLATTPDLLLIGIDPDRDQVQVWSGQHLRELSLQELVSIISTEDTEKESRRERETRGQGENLRVSGSPSLRVSSTPCPPVKSKERKQP